MVLPIENVGLLFGEVKGGVGEHRHALGFAYLDDKWRANELAILCFVMA